MQLLIYLFYIVFMLSAIGLIVVVLLQEGRGGGLGDALGSGAHEAFGPGARGINSLTAGLAGVFLVTAIAITILHGRQSDDSVLGDELPSIGAPVEPAPAPQGAPPAGG
jgi:preprotein translocase subunit SecG